MLHDQVEPTLIGRHLRRTFGSGEAEAIALNDVSLALYPGHINLLMGPSGSGKSTLLAALSGLLHPSAGKVIALGQDLWSMSDQQREHFRLKHCGFIFQGYNLFTALNARQQLEMVIQWGEGVSGREARRRAEQMLSILGLGNKMHLRPSEMSGGEKQRVAIGRALIKEPDFCFADEPTSALDWAHGEHIVELLRNAAHERGSTILIVAHDARIIPYADRVFHIEDGVLRESDDAASDPDLQRHYGKNANQASPFPTVPH
jgi:putative ABC transport system ATP-binding protein